MRICFFSGDIARTGGTERVTCVIASALAARGLDVCILSFSRGERAAFALDPAVTLHSLRMERFSANLSDWRIWPRLRAFVQAHRIDWLVDVDIVFSWYSIPATWRTDTKVISWEHFHLLVNVGDWPQRLRRSLGRRLAARFATTVVTLTQKDKRQYLRTLSCRAPVVVIPNPMTIEHRDRASPLSRTVLSAGRLVPQKGFDLLISAWAQIAHEHPEWSLRIVGSGPDQAPLKAQAARSQLSDCIAFVPATDDMAREYRAASVFALSSRFEGFGLVLIEAKSFGLPIVSFDCDCGPSDIVRHEHDGLLVRAKDIAGFAGALRRLMSDANERSLFGARALNDGRFEPGPITAKWVDILSRRTADNTAEPRSLE